MVAFFSFFGFFSFTGFSLISLSSWRSSFFFTWFALRASLAFASISILFALIASASSGVFSFLTYFLFGFVLEVLPEVVLVQEFFLLLPSLVSFGVVLPRLKSRCMNYR